MDSEHLSIDLHKVDNCGDTPKISCTPTKKTKSKAKAKAVVETTEVTPEQDTQDEPKEQPKDVDAGYLPR